MKSLSFPEEIWARMARICRATRRGRSRPALLARLGAGLLLLCCTLQAVPARAQTGLTIRFHSTRDSVVSPPVAGCGSGGSVGGAVGIHVGFERPSNMLSATFRELRVHEMAGHVADLVHTGAFTGSAHPQCGDSETMVWGDVGWLTTDFHNGEHQITAVVELTLVVNGEYVTQTLNGSAVVNVGNLLITSTTPSNPVPAVWTGAAPVMLSASFSCCYRAPATAKLEIFTTEQVLVRILTRPITTADISVQFEWDGMPEGRISPDDLAPIGPYLFRFTLETTSASPTYQDQDKSTFLGIGPGAEPVEIVATSVGGATYRTYYQLSSDRPASEGEIKVFNDDEVVGQAQIPASALGVGAQSATVQVNSDSADLPILLTSARDDHATRDRGHRLRWALQHNQQPKGITVGLFGNESPGALAEAWKYVRSGWRRGGKVTYQGFNPRVHYSLSKPAKDARPIPVPQPAAKAGAATGYYTLHSSLWRPVLHY